MTRRKRVRRKEKPPPDPATVGKWLALAVGGVLAWKYVIGPQVHQIMNQYGMSFDSAPVVDETSGRDPNVPILYTVQLRYQGLWQPFGQTNSKKEADALVIYLMREKDIPRNDVRIVKS